MRDKRMRRPTGAFRVGSALVLAGALLLSGHGAVAPAAAADLPTWDDVQKAKKNEATAAAKAKEIEGLIAEGEKELERLRTSHADAVAEFRTAEQAFVTASEKARTLDKQAKKSKEEADAAAEQAAVIVAQMYRSGGVDRSVELFLESEGDTADALLDRLASMSKATERNTAISETAEQAKNTAESLGEQAQAAADERERLRAEKEAAEQAAAQAVDGQREKVQAQEAQQEELKAQVEALKDKTTKTVDGYKERLRREAEERRRAEEAAAAAAANNNGGGGNSGGGSGGGGGGTPGAGSSGWLRPTFNYYISEGFRPPGRPDHTGIDLATACWTPVVAPVSGTVAMAGWIDNMGGNMVYLNQDNGYQTRFAHLVAWPPVGYGQRVNAGQVIGYVGSTGASSGCHLHYEVRPNQDNGWYAFIDPSPFL